eukprot:tig00001493_g8990.t1
MKLEGEAVDVAPSGAAAGVDEPVCTPRDSWCAPAPSRMLEAERAKNSDLIARGLRNRRLEMLDWTYGLLSSLIAWELKLGALLVLEFYLPAAGLVCRAISYTSVRGGCAVLPTGTQLATLHVLMAILLTSPRSSGPVEDSLHMCLTAWMGMLARPWRRQGVTLVATSLLFCLGAFLMHTGGHLGTDRGSYLQAIEF